MTEPIYVVQWNLGGLSDPIKMIWNDELQSYWSECGDFDYNPKGQKRFGVWQVAFNRHHDAEKFHEGCRFTCQWFRERMKHHD